MLGAQALGESILSYHLERRCVWNFLECQGIGTSRLAQEVLRDSKLESAQEQRTERELMTVWTVISKVGKDGLELPLWNPYYLGKKEKSALVWVHVYGIGLEDSVERFHLGRDGTRQL